MRSAGANEVAGQGAAPRPPATLRGRWPAPGSAGKWPALFTSAETVPKASVTSAHRGARGPRARPGRRRTAGGRSPPGSPAPLRPRPGCAGSARPPGSRAGPGVLGDGPADPAGGAGDEDRRPGGRGSLGHGTGPVQNRMPPRSTPTWSLGARALSMLSLVAPSKLVETSGASTSRPMKGFTRGVGRRIPR